MFVTPKEASKKVGFFNIVEALGNGRTIMIQTNELRILSAYKYTENNAPREQQRKRPVGHGRVERVIAVICRMLMGT